MRRGPIRRAAGTIGLLALVPTAVMLIKGNVTLHVAAVRAGVTRGSVLVLARIGPVLFLLDDVLMTGPNLDRMMAELARRGGFVVPWSNDVGMDHFCGPLPDSQQAAGRLRERAATLGAAPSPRVVRPSCLLAGRDDLALLAGSHIVDPRLRLDLVDLAVTIAPRAVVAHDSTCTASL